MLKNPRPCGRGNYYIYLEKSAHDENNVKYFHKCGNESVHTLCENVICLGHSVVSGNGRAVLKSKIEGIKSVSLILKGLVFVEVDNLNSSEVIFAV